MPVLTHMGPAAPAGLLRYDGQALGADYRDNLFTALFNMHKVTRHVLAPSGATFSTRDEDFLVSSNVDFHPTQVLEDADGSLLVIDTGGWYKLCCPTSQLVKPDVLGAIYRIRRQGVPRLADPRGLKLLWPKLTPRELVGLLADPRPAVRKRAIQTLAGMNARAMAALMDVLRKDQSAEARRNAVWTATRIDHADARAAVRAALADREESVRQAALHSVSVWRDRRALAALLPMLQGSSLPNRRAAAEALGRIGDSSAVSALLEAVAQPSDRALEHSLTFALIEIADSSKTAAGLKSANVRVRRAALTALDQMEHGGLEGAGVASELTSSDPALKEAAWWIAGRHPEWGSTLATVLRERMAASDMTAAQRDAWARQLARFARAAAVQELLAERLGDAAASPEMRRIVLRAMKHAGLKQAPATWLAALTGVLGGKEVELTREAVATVRALSMPKNPPAKLVAALLAVARDANLPEDVRLEALSAVPDGLTGVEPSLFALLRAQLGVDQSVSARAAAVDVLARAKLSSEQLVALTDSMKTVGPMEINRLMETFAQCADERVGQSLIAALKACSARAALRRESLKAGFAKASPSLRQEAEELFAALNVDTAKQQARLEQLLASAQGGDVRRGQAVFNSTKAGCSACHAIGYLGGTIGPDLTQIGRIRVERDLLEAIVFPSASFVRGYEPVVVTTRDGKVQNGVIRRDAADEIVLALDANREVRIARGDIEDVQPSRVSVMPAGLDQQLSLGELADLLAFLKACR